MNWGTKGKLTPAAPSTANRSRVGVVTQMGFVPPSDRVAFFSDLQARGIQHIRDDWRWEMVELTPGVFDWSIIDETMTLASRHGISVLPNLCFAAKWASSGDTKFYPPSDPATFGNYCARLVERYGRGGRFWAEHPELVATPVTAAEVWNEPWLWRYWAPAPDVRAYARLTRAAVAAIRPFDANFEVLISGDYTRVSSATTSGHWLRDLLTADPTLDAVVNGYTIHPYPNVRSWGPYEESVATKVFSRVEIVHDDVIQMGRRNLPWWITEIGWSNGNVGSSAPYSERGVSEETSATYIAGALVRAVQEWPFVKRVYIEKYRKSTGVSTDFWGNAGLLRADGSPKPALERITSYLAG